MAAHFAISLTGTDLIVAINGEDISEGVNEIHIRKAAPYAVPEVAVVFNAEAVTLQGEGIVAVQSDENAAQIVEALDPETVEKLALASSDMTTNATEAILAYVTGALRGSN